MTIIYLHGFASAGNGAKAQALRQRFGLDSVLAPDLPIHPLEVQALVDELLRTAAQPAIVVGTSLGGFYASYFSARWKVSCVLVNPSTAPSRTLGSRPGRYRNFSTGAEFEVHAGLAELWARMEHEASTGADGALVSLFVAEDDDVLASEIALRQFAAAAFKSVMPDGGHRFSQHWDKVMDRIAVILAGPAAA